MRARHQAIGTKQVQVKENRPHFDQLIHIFTYRKYAGSKEVFKARTEQRGRQTAPKENSARRGGNGASLPQQRRKNRPSGKNGRPLISRA